MPLHPRPLLTAALLVFLSALAFPVFATPPVTTYEYDPLGHRTWVVDPLLRPTQHSYDARGCFTLGGSGSPSRETQSTTSKTGVKIRPYDLCW